MNPIACPTYDNDSLDKVLQDMIGNRKIGQVRDFYPWLDILIPALNITDDSYKVFDNIDGADDLVTLKEAAQMTSAAPSYYSGR